MSLYDELEAAVGRHVLNTNCTPTSSFMDVVREVVELTEQRLVEIERLHEDCDNESCAICSVLDCPHADPQHYHPGGCPSCDRKQPARRSA